jgi:hypothetical protein
VHGTFLFALLICACHRVGVHFVLERLIVFESACEGEPFQQTLLIAVVRIQDPDRGLVGHLQAGGTIVGPGFLHFAYVRGRARGDFQLAESQKGRTTYALGP